MLKYSESMQVFVKTLTGKTFTEITYYIFFILYKITEPFKKGIN